jgi:putative ABC transport system ATP-binding protein
MTTHTDPIISTRSLTRTYALGNTRVTGVAGIDLQIVSGDIVVLKGDSGSGKSTLLSMFAALDRPTSGELAIGGTDLVRASEARLTQFRRKVVGMVFQSFNLLPTLNVMENICLPALLTGQSPEEINPRAGELLDWLNLKKRERHFPAQLSGGEMQRTAIARALINEPRVVLADEPTGNLDSANSRAVVELLSELNRRWGCTVVIATHSDMADPFATHHIRLRDGRVAENSCSA